MKTFFKYAGVGILNAATHWTVFYLAFAFYPKQSFTEKRFILFTSFMGIVSLSMGALSDMLSCPPIVTLVSFLTTSLVLGFPTSKYIVFKR